MFNLIYQLGQCTTKDSDECLRNSPTQGNGAKCKLNSHRCDSYEKDVKRCCPITCGVEEFTEDECNKSSGSGTCIYPNEAQCPEKGKLMKLSIRQIRYKD